LSLSTRQDRSETAAHCRRREIRINPANLAAHHKRQLFAVVDALAPHQPFFAGALRAPA